jgi:hypothetical protein
MTSARLWMPNSTNSTITITEVLSGEKIRWYAPAPSIPATNCEEDLCAFRRRRPAFRDNARRLSVLAIRMAVHSGCTRNGHDISRLHRHIVAPLAALPAARFVLNGELVVLDEDGRSNFAKLAHGRAETHYYGFDLLMLANVDLRVKPLEMRKAALANLLQGCGAPVRYCDHIVGRGRDFFDAVRKAGH